MIWWNQPLLLVSQDFAKSMVTALVELVARAANDSTSPSYSGGDDSLPPRRSGR